MELDRVNNLDYMTLFVNLLLVHFRFRVLGIYFLATDRPIVGGYDV
jgi:hypothetical protein